MAHTVTREMTDVMQKCIDDCNECAMVCNQTISHCLEMGGKHAEVKHITLLQDCAEICELSTRFMLRNSDFSTQLCDVCAQICERCAQDCEQFRDDQRMLQCAETCRRCAESCRNMSA